jgi:hypothetical protein
MATWICFYESSHLRRPVSKFSEEKSSLVTHWPHIPTRLWVVDWFSDIGVATPPLLQNFRTVFSEVENALYIYYPPVVVPTTVLLHSSCPVSLLQFEIAESNSLENQ